MMARPAMGYTGVPSWLLLRATGSAPCCVPDMGRPGAGRYESLSPKSRVCSEMIFSFTVARISPLVGSWERRDHKSGLPDDEYLPPMTSSSSVSQNFERDHEKDAKLRRRRI